VSETTTTASVPINPPAPPSAPNPPAAPVNPPASAPPSGVISDAAYDSLSVADQDRFSRVRKGPDGGSQWQDRATLPSETTDAAKTATGDGNAAVVTADGKLRVGDYQLSSDDIAMLMQQKAANDLRATQVPADGAYEAKLPEGLQLPEGVDFRPDPNDPSFKDFQALSKKLGLTQSDFEQLYGIWVNKTVQSEAAFRNSMKTELEALGANATMRVTALETWLRGTVGDDIAKHMRAGMFSAKIVQGLEVIAKKMASQGAASFSQAHREPAGPQGRVSEEEYNAMGPSERWDYARGFDQKQFSGR
jgi:hypothetical protein